MFSSLKKLPLTVDLAPGESATSFGSRLARRNGVQRLITFCSDVGIDYFALANGDPQEVARLAALGGVDPAALQTGTPQLVEPGWFRLGQERIKFTAFSRTSLRSCPACLAEGQPLDHSAHRGLWQLTSIRTCPVHACYLVPLPPRQNGNDTFDVMRLLERYIPVPASAAAIDDLEFERYLCQRVLAGPRHGWLDQLPFHVASQTCEGFGLLLRCGAEARRDLAGPADWAAAGSAGFQILRHGLDSFRVALKQIQLSHPIDSTLYRTRFRVFFEWLRYRDDDPDFDVIRDVVRDFVFRNFPIAEGQIVLGRPCPEQYVHSLATAKSSFGISAWKLGRRLAELGHADRGTGKRYVLRDYVPTAVVQGLATEVGSLLNATEAAQAIGIDRILLAKLTDHKLVQRYYQDHNASPLYHPEHLHHFLNRLRHLVRCGGEDGEAVDILTAARRVSVPTERVIKIILEHRLPLWASRSSTATLRDLKISVPILRQALNATPEDAVKPTQVAKALGINIRTVRALIDQGLLKPSLVRERQSGRTRRYVSAKSVEAFASEHVTVVDLAARAGRLPGSEAIIQKDRGAEPLALGPRCNRIFRKHDVGMSVPDVKGPQTVASTTRRSGTRS